MLQQTLRLPLPDHRRREPGAGGGPGDGGPRRADEGGAAAHLPGRLHRRPGQETEALDAVPGHHRQELRVSPWRQMAPKPCICCVEVMHLLCESHAFAV